MRARPTTATAQAWLALIIRSAPGIERNSRRATGWIYAGAALLLLAYVGSRFVLEVLLRRSALT